MAHYQDRDRDDEGRGGGYHGNSRGVGNGRYHYWDGNGEEGYSHRDRSGFGDRENKEVTIHLNLSIGRGFSEKMIRSSAASTLGDSDQLRNRGFKDRDRIGGFHNRRRGHYLRNNWDLRDGSGGFHDDEQGSGHFRRGRRYLRGGFCGQTEHLKSLDRDIRRSKPLNRDRSPPPIDAQWFKVTINEGTKHSKDWLFQQLRSNTNIEFKPISYHVIADKVLFFTQDAELADALKHLDIHTNTGKLSLFVRESEPPRSLTPHNQNQNPNRNELRFMDEDPTEVVQDILAACYDTKNKSLNMEQIARNERAKQHNMHGFFGDSVMVSIMLNLIGTKCSDLAGLNLSRNNIPNLSHLIELPKKAPELKELNLSFNRIHNLQELEKLRGLQQLHALYLNDNPCCKRYKDASQYRRDVRAIFPRLRVLDNEQLSDPIIVGIGLISGSIPTCKSSFLGPEGTSRIVLAFIENYYEVYDSGKRDDLIMGYDTNSYFSLSVNSYSTIKHGPGFGDYKRFSRNLISCKDANKRRRLMLCGRFDIVHQLRQFPNSQHDTDSFIVDVMCITASSIVFNIWGIFYECTQDQKKDVMRGFSRTFNICINDDSIFIKNDQLTLHHATSSSADASNRLQSSERNASNTIIAQQTIESALPVTVPQTVQTQLFQPNTNTLPQNLLQPSLILPPLTSILQNLSLDPQPKDQLIQNLCLETRLKAEWAEMCLEQNEWNYDHSIQAFRILQEENKIPLDAFD